MAEMMKLVVGEEALGLEKKIGDGCLEGQGH